MYNFLFQMMPQSLPLKLEHCDKIWQGGHTERDENGILQWFPDGCRLKRYTSKQVTYIPIKRSIKMAVAVKEKPTIALLKFANVKDIIQKLF